MTITDVLGQCSAGNLVFTGICDPNRIASVYTALQPDEVSGVGTLIQMAPPEYVPYHFEVQGEAKAKDEYNDASIDVLYIGNNSNIKPGQALIDAWLPKIKPGGHIICFDHNAEADAEFIETNENTTNYPPNWYRQC